MPPPRGHGCKQHTHTHAHMNTHTHANINHVSTHCFFSGVPLPLGYADSHTHTRKLASTQTHISAHIPLVIRTSLQLNSLNKTEVTRLKANYRDSSPQASKGYRQLITSRQVCVSKCVKMRVRECFLPLFSISLSVSC